jgi:subtilisin family serine protease
LMNSIGLPCGIQKYINKCKNGPVNLDFPILACIFSALPHEIVIYLAHPVKKERSLKKIRCTKKATRITSIIEEEYDGWFYDFTVDDPSHTYIANGHFVSNTHVSGIISANNNAIGIVGVAPKSHLIAVKVLGDDGSGSMESIIDGIRAAMEMKVDVINMSLGSPSGDGRLHNVIREAHRRNIPIICAAGNAGTRRLDFPAAYPETIAIGAIDKKNIRATFSQMGPNLDFLAPGVNILSTVPTNSYLVMSGTSMATPWVSGVVALMLAKHRKKASSTPIRDVNDIREHLKKSAIGIGQLGKDEAGFGLIDTKKLFKSEAAKMPVEDRLAVLEERVMTLESVFGDGIL